MQGDGGVEGVEAGVVGVGVGDEGGLFEMAVWGWFCGVSVNGERERERETEKS